MFKRFKIKLIIIFFISALICFSFMENTPSVGFCFDSQSSQVNFDDFDKEFEQIMSGSERKWDEYAAKQEKAWKKYKKAVEDKWESFVTSTKKEWVDYSKDKSSRSRVDFEKGYVEIETVVPAGTPDAVNAAEKKIAAQTRKILSNRNIIGENLLKGQIKDKNGKIISENNENEFIAREVIPEIKLEKKEFRAKDGIARIKYKAKIQMVPDHLKKRAERYLPLVKKNAASFSVNPQLILAVIHTESYFNPMAVSHCGAIGLMQIIPRYAGCEAYKFVYNKEKMPDSSYLYKPENNIELGAAYLHLLQENYFSSIPENPKNRYLTICGYNWGPGSMKKKIMKKYNIHNMSDADLFGLLRKKTPKETSDYLKRVTERMPLYASFF